MEKKYIMSGERRTIRANDGRLLELQKVTAVKDFDVNIMERQVIFKGDKYHETKRIRTKHVRSGEVGGWIESESNLSQEGNAWIGYGAVVFGKAIIQDDAWVGGRKTTVAGEVIVGGESKIFSDDNDLNEKHRTDVSGKIKILGYSNILASIWGEGVIKNKLIDSPRIIRQKNTSPPQAEVLFECSIGDRRISKKYIV